MSDPLLQKRCFIHRKIYDLIYVIFEMIFQEWVAPLHQEWEVLPQVYPRRAWADPLQVKFTFYHRKPFVLFSTTMHGILLFVYDSIMGSILCCNLKLVLPYVPLSEFDDHKNMISKSIIFHFNSDPAIKSCRIK